MKIINALLSQMKRTDNTSTDRLEKNRVRSTLEDMCAKYLTEPESILEFEALPNALPFVISVLEEPVFLEKYEFEQVYETLFQIREKEIQLI